MEGSQAADGSSDRSRAAVDFAHRLLLQATSSPGLDTVVGELAAAYAVSAAGMADHQSGLALVLHRADPAAFPEACPWESDPELLARIRGAADAVTVSREAYSFLVVAVSPPGGGGWLLWIGDSSRANWTAPEKSALVLIAQVISRHLTDGGELDRGGQQLERSIRQQNMEQAAGLARRLAHDFGNVLTGILGFSELAMAHPQPPAAPLARFINEIYRSAQAGAQLTHQLQLFSRRQVSSQRQGLIPAVLADEAARFRSAAGDKVRWDSSVGDDLPPVALDPDHLRQVLGAVLDNAREAMGEQGTVTITARSMRVSDADCLDYYGSLRPGPHVEITVCDSGPGLCDEAQRRLFLEPFYTSKSRRRGFGLAVAFGLLSGHRGGLSITNGPHGGVIARVLVPTTSVPIAPMAQVAPSTPARVTRGEKVLVVDDDPMILQFVSTTLEQAGYCVKAVTTADEALECYAAAASDPFRLVLSDVVMPRVNGVDLARRLATCDANARILFMSGQVSPDFGGPDLADQEIDLLTKPFRPEGLLRAVRGVLDRDAASRAAAVEAAAPAGGAVESG
jgi:signal transduction histidine kinase/ActR/RegA family two-component response regulator